MKTIEEVKAFYGPKLAEAAFKLGAIKLNLANPFTWASGYRMPIYNDNRQFLASSEYRALIRDAFVEMLNVLGYDPENIAGTATAGIPHATSLADKLQKPLSYIRSSSKDHGMQNQIEGLPSSDYGQKEVLLIEDLISTGKSSIQAVNAIKNANGKVPYCFAIFTYGLDNARDAFLEAECEAITILSYETMIKTAVEVGYINKSDEESLKEWRKNPTAWGENRNFKKVEK